MRVKIFDFVEMEIKIKKIENGKLPTYETSGSSGADCYARISNSIDLPAGGRITIPLGFAVEIPNGYEMQIRGRSGLARKHGIKCFLGTIDCDYRGEVSAILLNTSKNNFKINPFDRIAQAVICPVIRAEWKEVEELNETERGVGGFGSTGINKPKFYEPFTTTEQVEEYIGKEVVIDEKEKGSVDCVKVEDVYGRKSLVIEIKLENGSIERFTSSLAFSRITVNNHRFGKPIFEE